MKNMIIIHGTGILMFSGKIKMALKSHKICLLTFSNMAKCLNTLMSF